MVVIVSAEPAFFGRNYDEALTLLVAARDYVALSERANKTRLGMSERLRLCCETMRMTARLTQVMAWLMAQKAIHAGEMTQRELVEKQGPLGSIRICMEPGQHEGLPKALIGLLHRSHNLYVRIARLDERVRQQVQEGFGGEPESRAISS
jgi:regulator of CtrA degradation